MKLTNSNGHRTSVYLSNSQTSSANNLLTMKARHVNGYENAQVFSQNQQTPESYSTLRMYLSNVDESINPNRNLHTLAKDNVVNFKDNVYIKMEQDNNSNDVSNFIASDYPRVHNTVGPSNLNENNWIGESTVSTEKFAATKLILLYCQHCKRTFEKLHKKKQLDCENCSKPFQYQCVNCDKRYLNHRSAITHVKHECKNRLGFRCVLCDFRTNHRKGLVRHIENVHSAYDPSKSVICTKCGRIYKNYKNLRKHQLSDCGKTPHLECDYCGYKSNHKSTLRNHIKNRHTQIDPNDLHECQNCGKRYKTTSYFKKHKLYLCKKLAEDVREVPSS